MIILQQTRGLLSSNDQLSLDLPFAETKSLTARIGPTPILTRGSTGTFVGSNGLIQSAAVNIARFDHNPVTLSSRGLLIEESRANLLLRSEEFNETYWTPIRAPLPTANTTTSPDGLTTAEKLIADTTAANNHRVDRATVTLALNSVYTLSVFAKASEYTGIALGVGLSATQGVNYSLVGAGTVTPVAAGNTGTIQQLANGWYRCTCTFTSNATTAVHRVAIFVGQNGTTFNYAGDNTSGIFIWGAQLELGSFATSYIPTTTASLTRSADVCSITGANFTSFWNRFAGTCIVEVGSSLGNEPRFVSNLTAARALEISGTTSIDFFEASGVQQVRIVTIPTYPIKLGLAYAINDYQSSYSGLLGGSDTNTGGTIPDATALHIGTLGGTSNRLTGHIRSIRYYKKRLPNAKLQALTI